MTVSEVWESPTAATRLASSTRNWVRLSLGIRAFKAATFAYTSTAFPMLTGTLVTIAGFVPVGFAQSAAGEYCFSLFAVVATRSGYAWAPRLVGAS